MSKTKNHRLNSVSAGAEAVMHVILALFSLCCIIPFIFVVIILKHSLTFRKLFKDTCPQAVRFTFFFLFLLLNNWSVNSLCFNKCFVNVK